jgi:hypothetical protein
MPVDVDDDNDFDDLNTSNNSAILHDDIAISDNHFFAQKSSKHIWRFVAPFSIVKMRKENRTVLESL